MYLGISLRNGHSVFKIPLICSENPHNMLFLHQESHLFMRFLLHFARKVLPLHCEVH